MLQQWVMSSMGGIKGEGVAAEICAGVGSLDRLLEYLECSMILSS
jgi:hypothetical protein